MNSNNLTNLKKSLNSTNANNKKQVQLTYMFHKEMQCIGIHFTFNPILNEFIKNLEGTKYSNSHKCYYLKYEESTFTQLIGTLKKSGIHPDYRGFFKNIQAHSK